MLHTEIVLKSIAHLDVSLEMLRKKKSNKGFKHPFCEKWSYREKNQARSHQKRLKNPTDVYKCICGYWHVTSKKILLKDGMRNDR